MLGMCNPGVGVSSVPDTSGRVAPRRGSVRWRLEGGKAVVVRTGAETLRAGILIVNGLRACLSGPTLRAKQWRQRRAHRRLGSGRADATLTGTTIGRSTGADNLDQGVNGVGDDAHVCSELSYVARD